eukprot:g7881.t1
MASSKPKKGFSMSLSKPKSSSSSSSAAAKGGDRAVAAVASVKPSAIGVAHDDGDEDEDGAGGKRDYVTGIGGGRVVTKEVVVERGPRVIALVSNPWANSSGGPSSAGAAGAGPKNVPRPTAAMKTSNEPAPAPEEKSLDQLAVEAIARESRRVDGPGNGGTADGYGLGLDSDRVIGMVGKGGIAEAAPAAGATMTPVNRMKRTGLLEQNMIPGLMDVDGEDAKFKHDLGHRAEDLSVRSKAYVDVPVAEFGAALLRGMGWNGPEGDGGGGGAGGTGPGLAKDAEPRHHRLGLGAQPKPPEEMKHPRKRKPGEKPRASDAERLKMWEKKVQEERSRASQQSGVTKPLSVMDVVELAGRERGEEGGGRPRAMVLKTQGVPGLNKISVRMEETGEKVMVDKSRVTRVSEDELARRPFSDKKKAKSDSSSTRASPVSEAAVDTERRRRRRRSRSGSSGSSGSSSSRRRRRRERDSGRSRAAPNGSARKRSRSRSRSRSSSRGSADERGGDEWDRRKGGKKDKSSKKDKKKHKREKTSVSSKRERERERGREQSSVDNWKRPREDPGNGQGDTNGHGVNNGGDGGQQRPHLSASETQAWLRPNIRVRVVHKSYAGAYLGKGRVVDVPRIGQATVRMDVGDLVLEGVKERHLETVLPARGGKVVVVRGAEKGATGKLLAKNKETALVQVYEDLRALTLSLDDVAEFTGALDEDVDDVGY